jgi:hypothetical protein
VGTIVGLVLALVLVPVLSEKLVGFVFRVALLIDPTLERYVPLLVHMHSIVENQYLCLSYPNLWRKHVWPRVKWAAVLCCLVKAFIISTVW